MTLEEIKTPQSESTPRRSWRIGPLVILVVLAASLGLGIRNGLRARVKESRELSRVTDQAAASVVRVVHPSPGAPLQEIILPGNTQAFTDSPIYARTSGYLARWYFDIGARVKKGDLLAEIETPEIDQQLQQAQAQLETAQANFDLAKTTAERWQALLKTNSVSKQETDQAIANMAAQKAVVDSNSANVRRLQQLQSFEKVYAPFDGVVTARSTDIGALIDAGSSAQGRELFHLAAISTLRVFVPVPEVYSAAARPGSTAALTLDEYPGRVFHGRLARNSSAIEPTSHTLLVEIDVDNPEGLLLPGAYVSVHLKLPSAVSAATIPANTLLFRREGLRVAVVRNGHAELVPVTIGRDYGAKVEIVSGLRLSDAIILDPSDSLESGAPVRLQTGGVD